MAHDSDTMSVLKRYVAAVETGDEQAIRDRFAEEKPLHGDPASSTTFRATGVRPFPIGKSFVPRLWGGDFGEYTDFAGTRVPSCGEAWWQLPEGRFVSGVDASRRSSSSERRS
jgi:hypothetical protein